MCGRALYDKTLKVPGSSLPFRMVGNRYISGKWGMFPTGGNRQFNVRIEQLKTTWNSLKNNRGIVEFDGFFEHGFYFSAASGKVMIPLIYDKDYEFAIITRAARKKVAPIHNRQPIILNPNEADQWLETGKIIQLDDEQMLRVHESKIEYRRA